MYIGSKEAFSKVIDLTIQASMPTPSRDLIPDPLNLITIPDSPQPPKPLSPLRVSQISDIDEEIELMLSQGESEEVEWIACEQDLLDPTESSKPVERKRKEPEKPEQIDPWTIDKTVELFVAIQKYGPSNFQMIERETQMTQEQCREKYFTIINTITKKAQWSTEEDDLLLSAKPYNSLEIDWDIFGKAYLLGTRNGRDCKKRYEYLKVKEKKSLNKQLNHELCVELKKLKKTKSLGIPHRWSVKDDKTLLDSLVLFPNNWEYISKNVFKKAFSPTQCKYRFTEYLNPMIKQVPFDEEEDKMLEHALKIHGPKFSLIAKEFFNGKRSSHQIRNRFNMLTIKKEKEALRSTLTKQAC